MLFALLATCAQVSAKSDLAWLHAEAAQFVNEQGQSVTLRGCNLGNWLLLEMWMLAEFEVPDQRAFMDMLTRRFGAEETWRLMELYRENFIAERDFDIIRSFGFNTVRVPFDYTLLEDDAKPLTLREGAFRWLDRAVEMARERGMYVILDLHGAPGGQSVDQCTGRSGQNRLWSSRSAQDRVVWLWTEIARHYAHEPAIAAYDLLNEPFGDNRTEQHHAPLVELMGRVYEAVRAVDERHVIIFPGPRAGIEIYGDPAARGWQQVGFTEHYYPGLFGDRETLESHARFIGKTLSARADYLKKLKTPFLVGEFNVVFSRLGGPQMMRRYYDVYGSNGWAATMWSYKLLNRRGGVGSDNWYMVTNEDPLPPLNLKTMSLSDVEAWFGNLGVLRLGVYETLRAALTNSTPETIALSNHAPLLRDPPARDDWPPWTATDIGDSRPGGQRVWSSNEMDVFGGGRDIWGEEDQFRFLWRPATAPFELSARMAALEETHPHAKAGLMWRASLDPGAPLVLLHVFPDGQISWGWRDAAGAAMQERRVHVGTLPVSLRLTGQHGQVEAAWSADGNQWTTIERRSLPGGASPGLVGFAVLAHDNNESLTTAAFREIRANFSAPPTMEDQK